MQKELASLGATFILFAIVTLLILPALRHFGLADLAYQLAFWGMVAWAGGKGADVLDRWSEQRPAKRRGSR